MSKPSGCATTLIDVVTEPSPKTGKRAGLTVFLVGVCAIACGQWSWARPRLTPGLVLVLVGILFVAISPTPRLLDPASAESPRRLRYPLLEACFLAALVVAGGSVRFLGLDHIPPGGFFDEIQNHLVADEILKGDRPVFVGGWSQMPALFFYILAAAIAVVGKGLTTVRSLSALFGTLTLPAFYFLARRAFAWPVAAATSILLAGSRWHITFSRVGFATIIGPLVEVLAVLCLWKAMETRERLYFVLLGVVTGVGLQCYYSFTLFPAVMAVAAASFAARKGWRLFFSELRPILRGLGWSVLVAALLLFPLARFAVRHPDEFFQRSNAVAIWNLEHRLPWPGIFWQNTVSHLLMFNYRGDWNPRHNIPAAPLLNPIEGVLLAIGIGLAIGRAWKWPHTLGLAWFLVMLLPAILTIEAPQAHRAVGAIPAMYLLIGEGLQGLYGVATVGARKLPTAIAAALLFAATVAGASHDVWRYFRVQVRSSPAWSAFQADYHAVAEYIKPFAGIRDIWISGVYYEYPILTFRLGEGFPYHPFLLSNHLPAPPTTSSPASTGNLYVLEPFLRELFPLFQALYPHARLEEHSDPFGQAMFVSVFVPREELEHPADPQAAERGFLGAYYQNEDWQGPPALVRREPTVMFHFHLDAEALRRTFSADWAADLLVEEPGQYRFWMLTSGPTVLLLDDETIIRSPYLDQELLRKGTLTLSTGHHRIVVRCLKKGYFSRFSLLWQTPSRQLSAIPMRLLLPLSVEEYARIKDDIPRPRGE